MEVSNSKKWSKGITVDLRVEVWKILIYQATQTEWDSVLWMEIITRWVQNYFRWFWGWMKSLDWYFCEFKSFKILKDFCWFWALESFLFILSFGKLFVNFELWKAFCYFWAFQSFLNFLLKFSWNFNFSKIFVLFFLQIFVQLLRFFWSFYNFNNSFLIQ